MSKTKMFVLLAVMLSLLAFVGCSKSSDGTTPSAPDSPLVLESPVVAPGIDSPLAPPRERFSLNAPVAAGASEVSGTGPAGTAIIIADVTLMSQELGSGVIQNDGTFNVQVDPPLIEGHIIGIKLGVVEGETLPPNYADQLMPYRGDGARSFPQLGFFWDTATVIP